ncbi:MMPL family transporter [Nocardia stercoris]|uniref:MMPL family transporter n=1 Tax=Nocardia stercoris TaxID=2483361 RepID=A0A3M2L170_9NOCA|nr:MMPL family transporter [Nocardia stercoris]
MEAVTGRTLGYRWGEFVARHARVVLGIWLLVLIACAAGYSTIATYLPPADISVSHSESARAADLVRQHFGSLGGEVDLIVFSSADRTVDDPGYRQVVDAAMGAARNANGVAGVQSPFELGNPLATRAIAPDRHAAVAVLELRSADPHQRARDALSVRDALADKSAQGVEVATTGYSPATDDLAATEKADTARAEAIGLPIALVLLLAAFGSVVAAGLPMVVAGIGLLTTFGVIAALMPVMNFSALVVTVATTLGTGVALDYALFVVSRFREELARAGIADRSDRAGVARAVGVAVATAGRTITVSGLIVMITLSSLLVVDSPVFHEISVGISATVLSLLVVALSALPALLAVLGPRVNAWSLPSWAVPVDARLGSREVSGRWTRWGRHVMRRPVRYAVVAVAVLGVASIPLGGMHYGLDLGGSALAGTESGRANTVLSQQFTPGLQGPVQIVVTGPVGGVQDSMGREATDRFVGRFRADERVWAITPVQADGRTLVTVIPAVAPDSAAATALVRDLRAAAPADSTVGGATAQFLDLATETKAKTGWVVGLVVLMSLALLALAFRSVVLPIKAVLINLLVTAASVGLAVAVFQWGHGARLLHFTPVGFVQVYLPVTVFVVLFGLSMDYEVFLLGRVREEWLNRAAAPDAADVDAGERNQQAVAAGLEHTARPITAAAAVMVVILLALLTADVLELKQFGLAIATAVGLDAVLVRLVLVPAVMRLLGRANWWPGSRISRVA